MKCAGLYKPAVEQESLPARGAWIEIIREYDGRERLKGRSPHGERGLK